ncbi:integrase catalytic domain-containing protein [Trichonephila clavipes]|nr:integrase catalytic domain-containing protein [Trichonephila clavipes]
MDAANKAILERTKKTRSVSRSLVTKQINKLEYEISNTADKTTVHEIYMQLISKFEELSTLDKEIENLIDNESLEEEIVTREEYRDKFIIWKIRAELSSILTNQPRLPKLTLESFSGKDISSFPSFWARFKSAVHENSSLNDVDKFSYLKSVVTSDAELAIRGLTLTSENYAKAIKILENRFGRKELIVDFHMNRLLNLTPVRKSFDVIALRNLYDQLEINIRGLESLEISPDSYSCLLFPIIMKAIPPDLALEYNKKHNETQSQITDLIAYLRSEVESGERTEFLVKPHDLELKNKNSYSNTKYFERTSHSYPQSNRRVQGHSRFHPSHKSFSSANELLTAAFSNFLFCFENTHMSDLCRHARAICFKLEKSKQNSHLDLEEKNVDVKTTSSNSVFHNRGGVLLQCVKAEIIGRSSSDKIFCPFDNGSEKSFIKKKCVSEVGVENIGLRNVLSGEETVIQALEIEEISKATLSLPNPDAWAEMESKGFRLTFSCNESSENCEISLLIGSDFYCSLTHRIKRLDSSLVAVETRLGWSLQGKCDERSDCTLVHLVHSEEESISTELRRFWEIERLGILDKGSVTLGNGDEEILSEFDKSVNFVHGRYRVNLPWKPVERTSCDSLLDSQGFYLPHHAVIRSDKTTSGIRIVFDGSAHENGQSSLNQSLYTGPNLHLNILELLLCFRKSPVAFTADVKSAFLQIELDFRDRDFTRFFWTDNLNNEPYVLNFTRVLFGLRPSPYLLAATLKHHFKKYREQYPHTFELLNSSIYVDDLICGQNDVPDALRTTLGSACKYSVTQACYCENGEERWTLEVEWDSELPPKLRHKWQQWSSEAEGLTEIKIPRFYLGNIDQEISKCEIHCFSDASKPAYGTILYLRFVTCNNEIETSFICSKSRVAPLKSLTLPRLELTAALLSARLAKQVSSCLKFDANIYYWTDSLISYYWIRGDSSVFKPYIKNRVQEIQLLSDPMQWGHCPGKDNPADLLLRGTSAVKLAQNELWWHGPPWLKLTPDHWPNRHRDILDSELCSEELECMWQLLNRGKLLLT